MESKSKFYINFKSKEGVRTKVIEAYQELELKNSFGRVFRIVI